MKKTKLTLIVEVAVVFVFGFFITNLYGIETNVSGYASLDYFSNYVWRGQKLSNSWVLQPSLGINYGAFGANIWTNYDTDSKIDEGNGHGEVTETDITLYYTHSINKLNLTAGFIYYALSDANDTQEIYLSAEYDVFLKPKLTIYYDFDEGNGAFLVASTSHSIELLKDISMNLGATASYNINNKVMGLNKDKKDFRNFYNAEISSSITILIWKNITVTPKVAYSFPLSNDSKEAIKNVSDDRDDDVLYGGVNLTFSF